MLYILFCTYLCGNNKSKPLVISQEIKDYYEMQEKSKTTEELDPKIEKIAKKLKELRIKKGYSSHETFAFENNLNRVQYWRIEKGSNITLKTLIAVLKIHNTRLSEFFEDID